MTTSRAKSLRKSMTDAERRLWYRLRAHRLANIKFKRQAVIGRHVVDFVCFERSLVIEVDGGQHDGQASDLTRDRWLTNEGFRVMRFWNNEVLNNTDAVLSRILEAMADPAYPSPGTPLRGAPPSPTRGEGNNRRSKIGTHNLIPQAYKSHTS
ncbi:MAG: endonuclease domain-containing protein [Proteobacteria bacterium]|nr:endonuclease domain-containing protein [Pseudomonadota bacterium]